MFNFTLYKEVFFQSRIPQLIGTTDFSTIQYNPAFCEFLGYSFEEITSLPLEAVSHPEDMLVDARLFGEILNGERDEYQLEKRYIHKLGEIKTGILTVSRIREKSTGEQFLLGQVLDITEKKHMEDALKKREKQLQKSEKLAVVGQMAAAVAHEIRNPLTPIKGFTQLLHSEKELNPVYLRIVIDELYRIETIISEFLSMAKPHAEKTMMVHVESIVKQVIQRFQSDPLLMNKQLHIESEQPIQGIIGDPSSLKQVFMNVIQNALEAISNNGRIDVSIFTDETGVIVKFTDNGCGIPKERLSKIGEPFYSTKEKGTGLGLMTCFRIIESHNGKINIESVQGEGTTVTIWLPYETTD
ncbi:PAS/PAC sensor signal transduction histidine kinase [Neobacillus bataviensis LMG 21833]|uniref:histidine kinase n=1 Tax=Neobacillus bataviensis LMG 21833 TaxID=1117379 RepID=K6CHY0_9BACI|nr:ATP-binding protein [Neobacillus bataviensis]EKN70755.1 PAS/PAC sensor signal transduction histidine kinase [Neobacillus bataviensis LMG 21833]